MHGDANRENVRHTGEERGREALSETKKCNVRQGGAARGTEAPCTARQRGVRSGGEVHCENQTQTGAVRRRVRH